MNLKINKVLQVATKSHTDISKLRFSPDMTDPQNVLSTWGRVTSEHFQVLLSLCPMQ